MKITDVKTWAVANQYPYHGGFYFVFVKLTTDNGISGYGEVYSVPFAPKVVCKMVEDVVERFVIGRSPFEIEKIWHQATSCGFQVRPDPSMGGVISSIEIACWDIVGKAVEQPIYNLLGGKVHERLRSYSYLYPEDSPAVSPEGKIVDQKATKIDAAGFFGNPDAMPERLQTFMDRGFTAVGLDPCMPMGIYDPRQLSLQDLDLAERTMKALRETAGTKCDLMVKTHGQMTTSSAVRLARRVGYDPLWFEEPVPPGNIEEMAFVASKTSIPICAGERFIYKQEFATLLEKRAASILNFAIAHVGGILEVKKIAAMAEAHYAQITPHLYAGPIEAVANIQLSACSTNFLLLESIERFGGFYGALLTKPIHWEDGYVTVPDGPGLGFELNEELCDANPVTSNEVHPPTVADQDFVDQVWK